MNKLPPILMAHIHWKLIEFLLNITLAFFQGSLGWGDTYLILMLFKEVWYFAKSNLTSTEKTNGAMQDLWNVDKSYKNTRQLNRYYKRWFVKHSHKIEIGWPYAKFVDSQVPFIMSVVEAFFKYKFKGLSYVTCACILGHVYVTYEIQIQRGVSGNAWLKQWDVVHNVCVNA